MKSIRTIGVVLLAMVLLGFGCSKANVNNNVGVTSGGGVSSYSGDYKVVPGLGGIVFVVTVSGGPVTKLGVTMSDPEGGSVTRVLTEEDMVTGQGVRFQASPEPGKWAITAKTFQGKIVWHKDIDWVAGQLSVDDVFPNIADGRLTGFMLGLKQTGNMPIIFTGIKSVKLDGLPAGSLPSLSMDDSVMVGEKYAMSVRWQVAVPPGNHRISGGLEFGKSQTLDFSKDFVVPGQAPGTRVVAQVSQQQNVPTPTRRRIAPGFEKQFATSRK